MTAWTLLILLTAHFVGDFICQTDWMATNKSKRWDALALHVSVYTFVVTIVTASTMPYKPWYWTGFSFWAITFTTHFVTDAITSRWTSKLWFFKKQKTGEWSQWKPGQSWKPADTIRDPWTYEGGNRHWFFCAIGFDQLIHAWTLALTWMWVMR